MAEISENVDTGADVPFADMFADLAATPFTDTQEEREKRKPGRPKGSQNRTTAQMRKFILSNYRDPIFNLLDIVAMHPSEVRREFGVKPKDAASIYTWALGKALEYLHQKQPIAVQVAAIEWKKVEVNLGAPPQLDPTDGFLAGLESVMNSIGYAVEGDGVGHDSVG